LVDPLKSRFCEVLGWRESFRSGWACHGCWQPLCSSQNKTSQTPVRVMGRQLSSPPPELLKDNLRPEPSDVNSTIVPSVGRNDSDKTTLRQAHTMQSPWCVVRIPSVRRRNCGRKALPLSGEAFPHSLPRALSGNAYLARGSTGSNHIGAEICKVSSRFPARCIEFVSAKCDSSVVESRDRQPASPLLTRNDSSQPKFKMEIGISIGTRNGKVFCDYLQHAKQQIAARWSLRITPAGCPPMEISTTSGFGITFRQPAEIYGSQKVTLTWQLMLVRFTGICDGDRAACLLISPAPQAFPVPRLISEPYKNDLLFFL
jgi:hypothetical protein